MGTNDPAAALIATVLAPGPRAGRVVRPSPCSEPGCTAETGGAAWCAPHMLLERDRAHRRMLARPEDQIPPHYQDARFGSALVRDKCPSGAVDEARRAFRDGALVVLLAGSTGSGKSVLAAALANEVRDAGKSPDCPQHLVYRALGLRWVTAMDLGTAREDSDLGDKPRIVRAAREATVLVIDEFGRQSDEQFASQRGRSDGVLFSVLDYRHAFNKPTIVTTFLTPAQLRADNPDDPRNVIDGGAMRRLLEPPHGRLVAMRRAPR